MLAEEYLQSIREMKSEIEYLKRARGDIANDIGYLNTSGPNPNRVQSSVKKDGLEMMAIKHMKRLGGVDKKIHNKILEYNVKRAKVAVLIHRLSDDQRRRFLLDYYMDGKSMDHLTKEYRYETIKSTYNLKARAVKLFVKNFEKEIQGFDKDILPKLKKNEKKEIAKLSQSLANTGEERK